MISSRLHSLDAMRALLMLLGVYFHLSLAYVTFGGGWATDVNSTSPFFDFVFGFLHYFRMHAFFLIAGFFGSLLYHKRGSKKMIANRFKRIFLPLIVMIGPVSILIDYSRKFSWERKGGHPLTESLSKSFSVFDSPWNLIPESTAHLWFLNYLFFMSLLAYVLKSILSKYYAFHSLSGGNSISNLIRRMISAMFLKPWMGTFLFCLSYGVLMMFLIKGEAQAESQWWSWLWFTKWEAIKTFFAFGFFYFIGWHMYHHKDLLKHISLKRQLGIFFTYSALLTVLLFGLFKILQYSPFPQINEGWGSTYNVTFNVDMSEFDFDHFYDQGNEFKGVFIQGEFNGWCGECDNKMTDEDGDGIYTKEIETYNGDYKFIFTINGWDGVKRDKENDFEEWISPGKEGLDCDVAPEFKDYVIQVFQEDVILDPICWKQCTDCNGDIIDLTSNGKKEPLESDPINLFYLLLWNFGVPNYIMLVMALCIRFFSTQSKTMRYISDASYWVYIIHLPLTHFIPGLFHGVTMNVFIKFSISSVLITVFAFTSYHFMIRSTFIGQFLNGRKY